MILGLASGIIVFILGITGALYAFKTEIESLSQKYKKVGIENRDVIPPSVALKIAEESNPDIHVHGVIYREPCDAVEVIYYQPDPLYYGAAYLNPYSGEVIKIVNFVHTFFGFVYHGHIALWLPLKIGMPIIAVAALVFLVMLITGLILWWPRKNSSSRNFSFTKGVPSSIKRLEQHKVVGFYVIWLGLLLVLTGMTFVFRGFDKVVYKAMGGKKDATFSMPPSDTTNAHSVTFTGEPIDMLFERIKAQNPEIHFIEIHAVEDSVSPFLVELNRDPSTYWKMDYLFFDQYTLEPIRPEHVYGSFDDADTPDKIKRMYYDIHTGSILGFPGKLLAFLASLFCASLPVTGFVMWRNRRKEKKAFLRNMNQIR